MQKPILKWRWFGPDTCNRCLGAMLHYLSTGVESERSMPTKNCWALCTPTMTWMLVRTSSPGCERPVRLVVAVGHRTPYPAWYTVSHPCTCHRRRSRTFRSLHSCRCRFRYDWRRTVRQRSVLLRHRWHGSHRLRGRYAVYRWF